MTDADLPAEATRNERPNTPTLPETGMSSQRQQPAATHSNKDPGADDPTMAADTGASTADLEPVRIPSQLHRSDLRFILVPQGRKKATELAWPSDCNYHIDHLTLALHTERGGNYGVFPSLGSPVVVIDADDYGRLVELGVPEIFGETFAVESGSSTPDLEKRHIYLEIHGDPLIGRHAFFDPVTGRGLGHIFAQHPDGAKGFVIGPGSLHESGRRYRIACDVPIACIPYTTWERFAAAVHWKEETSAAAITPRAASATGGSFGQSLGMLVTDIWQPPPDAARSGENVSFAHPVHGSTTGTNLSVNPARNVWTCRRCGSGGDAVLALAVDEGIIDCAQARPGALADPVLMERVKEAARRRGFDVDRAEREWLVARHDPRQSAGAETARPSMPASFTNLDGLELAIVRRLDPLVDRGLCGVLPGEDVASVDLELSKRLVHWHFDDAAIDQILALCRPRGWADHSDSRASTIALARDAVTKRRYDPAELVRKRDRRAADEIAKTAPAALATEIESGALRFTTRGEIPAEERNAHLRELALYLLNDGRTVPDVIKSVGRSNARILEPDRLDDPAVMDLVKRAETDLKAARRRMFAAAITCLPDTESAPALMGESPTDATAPEVMEEARKVLETGDPFEYMVQAYNLLHVGDRTLGQCMTLSLASRLAHGSRGLHVMATGASGMGKSDAFFAMLRLVPARYTLKLNVSDKALYYNKDLVPGMVLRVDDHEMSDGLQELLKAATSDFGNPTEYQTLTIDRELLICRIPERCLWWIGKVEGAGDDQVWNRMLVVWVDESPEQDQRILARTIKNEARDADEPIGEPREAAVCRTVWELLHTTGVVDVNLSRFALRIRFSSARNRRNALMFLDMIKSIALLRSRQREWRKLPGGMIRVYANEDDFMTAQAVFGTLDGESGSQTHKLTKGEKDVLDTIVQSGLDEFTLKDLQDLTGIPYGTVRKRMRGYDTRGKNHTGLLAKCPAISIVDRSEADRGDTGSTTVHRRQRAFQFNRGVYLDWVKGASVWLAPEDAAGADPSSAGPPASPNDCMVAAPLLQPEEHSNHGGNGLSSQSGAGMAVDGAQDFDVAADPGDSDPPSCSDQLVTGPPTHDEPIGSDPACTPSRCSNQELDPKGLAANEKTRPQGSLLEFCDLPPDAATVQQPRQATLDDIDPANYIPLSDGHLLEPCAVCGGRAVHYKVRFKTPRESSNLAEPHRICRSCYDAARKRAQARIRPLPGSLPIDEIERVDPDLFGRCDVCNLAPGCYRHHAHRTNLCMDCYSALTRSQSGTR